MICIECIRCIKLLLILVLLFNHYYYLIIINLKNKLKIYHMMRLFKYLWPESTVEEITKYLSFEDWIAFQDAYLPTYMEKIIEDSTLQSK